MAKITFTDKVTLNENSSIADINKCKANDMNEIKKVVNQNTPTGAINLYAGSTAPTGWLFCDGSAISRTDYADLFSVIGTTYGSGDGSTTFNLPDLKGNVPVGLNSTDSDFDTLGNTGGEKTHTLTIDEMPSHNHPNSTWTINPNDGATYYYPYARKSYSSGFGNYGVAGQGGDQAHNNLQPYIVLNYIISY